MVTVPSVPTSFARGAFLHAGLVAVAGAILSVVLPPVGVPLLLCSPGVLYFYRDPDRSAPPSGLVSPADGTVAAIDWEDGRVKLGVYLGLGDVHVVRSPFGGIVQAIDRESGRHLPAPTRLSEKNEKLHVRYDGATVTMRVGWLARRIVPYVGGGQRVRRGERIGHVAFGSRVDVLMPARVGPEDVEVEPGATVRAGETVLVEASAVDGRPGPIRATELDAGEHDGGDEDGDDVAASEPIEV